MLEAAMNMDKKVRLVCYEDQFEALLADLALHKLDVVLTDREVPPAAPESVQPPAVRKRDEMVVGVPALARKYRRNFPGILNGAPFLLPTRNNALRGRIDEWFVQTRCGRTWSANSRTTPC
jgi:LysR family transcriptional activator of nhaA